MASMDQKNLMNLNGNKKFNDSNLINKRIFFNRGPMEYKVDFVVEDGKKVALDRIKLIHFKT